MRVSTKSLLKCREGLFGSSLACKPNGYRSSLVCAGNDVVMVPDAMVTEVALSAARVEYYCIGIATTPLLVRALPLRVLLPIRLPLLL